MKLRFLDKKTLVTYFILLPIITITSIGMEDYFKTSIEKVEHNIIASDLKNTRDVAIKIDKLIKNRVKKPIFTTLKSSSQIRDNLEKSFQLLSSSKYTYIYLLHFDPQGKLRYLLDGATDPEQRGEFNQRFGQHDSLWEKTNSSGEAQFIKQPDINSLWATYLYPIKTDNRVEAILAIDFSYQDYAVILTAIRPMEKFFLYFSLFLLLILFVVYIQLYFIYHSRKKSIFDPLTKVYNRVYMDEILPKLKLENYAICMLDIDHFKRVNDNYGHGNGDRVLSEFTNRVQNQVRGRSGDMLFRYGGEEFLLLLHKLNESEIETALNRLRKEVKNRPIEIDHETQCLNITLSIGCNIYPAESRNITQAIEVADQLLYQAKEQGRDRVILNRQNP